MLDLSIIVVSWNTKDLLLECLASATNDCRRFKSEIIVVDNASSDGSPEAVQDKYPNVKLIRNKKNLGFAKANNVGIKHSIGRFICLLNSDIKIIDGCFMKMIVYMDGHPQVGILGPKILSPNGVVQRSCMGYPTLWNSFSRALALDTLFPNIKFFGGYLMTYWGHDTLRSVDIINGCFWMIRRDALNHVGLLDENFFMYGEDIDWCRRFKEASWDVIFFPNAKAIHYGGASSSKAPIKYYIEKRRSNLFYIKKYHGWFYLILFTTLAFIHEILRFTGRAIRVSLKPSTRDQNMLKLKRSLAILRWLLKIKPKSDIIQI